VKSFHSKIMTPSWQENFSLYEIVEAKFISRCCIDFTTNANESLHGSINECIRQTFKRVISFLNIFILKCFLFKRNLQNSGASFELLNNRMTRSLGEFQQGHEEALSNNTRRQLKDLKLVNKIIDFCKKNPRRERSFNENIQLFLDFLKIVTSQHEVILFSIFFINMFILVEATTQTWC
jgi:hypothetical protein